MTASTSGDYHMLLALPRNSGMVVSCYADMTVAEGFERTWRQGLKAEVTRIRGLLADKPASLAEFERLLASIRQVLDSPAAHRARGLAVFMTSCWEQPLALTSSEPYETRLVVGDQPYLMPMFETDSHIREYLVVLTDCHQGRLYAATPSEASVLDNTESESIRTGGERGQKQRDTIAHHRDHLLLLYRKELIGRIEAAWDTNNYQGIILLGEREVLENLRRMLPTRIARQVVREAPHSWEGRTPEICEEVRELVSETIAGRQATLLTELEGRIRAGCAVATGPQEVVEALDNNQVRDLIVGADPGEAASLCTSCRSLFAATEASCPYCIGWGLLNLFAEDWLGGLWIGPVGLLPTPQARPLPIHI